MPLRLNLYHEALKNKTLKRRDPLKLSLYVLIAIAAGFAAYYAFELIGGASAKDRRENLESQYATFEKQAKTSAEKQAELTKQITLGKNLTARLEDRFYWAPILAEIAGVVPREVQITRLAGDVGSGEVRRCKLALEGIAAGANARGVADEFRTNLAERFQSSFKTVSSEFDGDLNEGTESVALDGRQVPTVLFKITVKFSKGEAKAATPPPRRKR